MSCVIPRPRLGPDRQRRLRVGHRRPLVGVASDLDVVIRAPQPWSLEYAREIADCLNRLPARVDAQLDVPAGAVALDEYACGGPGPTARA